MPILDARIASILSVGFLSSSVLLAASTPAPTVTVSQLWDLGEDADLTVLGLLVSLRSYESGAEVLVLADLSGTATVKSVCTFGPGPAPSERVSIGDMLAISGQCTFEEGEPCVYCRYTDVTVLRVSEEALTVEVLSASWHLFEGDIIGVAGVADVDSEDGIWLRSSDGGTAIRMVLDWQPTLTGPVVVQARLIMDVATMSLVLEVYDMSPGD